MDESKLKTLLEELTQDPLGRSYAQWIPDSPGLLVELLNTPDRSIVKERFITARTVLAELDNGATILDKLESATGYSAVKWAMKFMQSDSPNAGIDIGADKTRQTIIALWHGGLFTQEECTQILGLAMQQGSRAEELGLGRVEESDIRDALKG